MPRTRYGFHKPRSEWTAAEVRRHQDAIDRGAQELQDRERAEQQVKDAQRARQEAAGSRLLRPHTGQITDVLGDWIMAYASGDQHRGASAGWQVKAGTAAGYWQVVRYYAPADKQYEGGAGEEVTSVRMNPDTLRLDVEACGWTSQEAVVLLARSLHEVTGLGADVFHIAYVGGKKHLGFASGSTYSEPGTRTRITDEQF
ncbi:hypothetical protein ACIHFB_39395 [Streptomyces sp. NPDC051963]|uniref:hypothetical protein n=1 Tax=Streptomyces sp. NPDC051963 TaxID=3365678 RepID=UPI0037CF83AE